MTRGEEKASLRFSLQETVFLDQDKPPIGQMEEIQLVPDIEVLERDKEIRIAGYLALYGQYSPAERVQEEEEEDHPPDYQSAVKFPPLRAEDSIYSPWKKSGEVYHQISVNITLPLDRITHLDDVFAVVDAFDYDIKSPHQLLISAELIITGINENKESGYVLNTPWNYNNRLTPISGDEKERYPGWDEQQSEQVEQSESSDPPVMSMEVDDRESQDEQSEEGESSTMKVVPLFDEEDEQSIQSEEKDLRDEESVEKEHTDEKERKENDGDVKVAITGKRREEDRERVNLTSYAEKKNRESTSQAESDAAYRADIAGESGIEQNQMESMEMEETDLEDRDRESESQIESQTGSSELEEEKEHTDQGLYLKQFLENREDDFTRLTIVIVQKEDSISSIAERYSLTEQQIMRYNKLESDHLEEGQILYMPRNRSVEPAEK